MAVTSDLRDLGSILEQAYTLVAADPAQVRATNLLDAARALTDVLLQSSERDNALSLAS